MPRLPDLDIAAARKRSAARAVRLSAYPVPVRRGITLSADSTREVLQAEVDRRVTAGELAPLESGSGADGAVLKRDLLRHLGIA
jgi:hypothetical protein